MTGFLSPSPKTKKELKTMKGQKVNVYNPTPFSCDQITDGRICVVGPDPFVKRSWYAELELKDSILVKVS